MLQQFYLLYLISFLLIIIINLIGMVYIIKKPKERVKGVLIFLLIYFTISYILMIYIDKNVI